MSGHSGLKRIAVMVSAGRHRVSAAPCYSRNDAVALELARQLADTHGATLQVLHAGDASNPALRDYLALGASRIEVVECEEGADPVAALAERAAGASLVLTGMRAEGAFDTGMLPYRLAAELGYALVGSALEISIRDDIRVELTQFMPKGARRRVEVALPLVVAVHPQAAAKPRYAYARMREGTIAKVGSVPGHDADAPNWTIDEATRKPVKLVAAHKRSGHARMLMATTTESRGGNVVIEGSSVEKAQVILAYLREHRLIDY